MNDCWFWKWTQAFHTYRRRQENTRFTGIIPPSMIIMCSLGGFLVAQTWQFKKWQLSVLSVLDYQYNIVRIGLSVYVYLHCVGKALRPENASHCIAVVRKSFGIWRSGNESWSKLLVYLWGKTHGRAFITEIGLYCNDSDRGGPPPTHSPSSLSNCLFSFLLL